MVLPLGSLEERMDSTTRLRSHGAGRVEVEFVWYSVPLMLVTLGTAVPSHLTVYCSTESAPSEGP